MSLVTYTKVELAGKEHLLKFDYNAICDLEETFNKGIAGILQEEQIGFRLVKIFYWAALKWKNPGLTVDRVGNLLGNEIQENGKTVAQLMEPVMEALRKSKLLGGDVKDDFGDFGTENENDDVEDLGDENPNV